nr:uncharacterized protein LOC128689947 [Cherax quadricarinatus]
MDHLELQPLREDNMTLLDVGSMGKVNLSWPGSPSLTCGLQMRLWPLTLCMWIKPHRFHKDDNVLYFGDAQRHRYFHLTMCGGHVKIRVTTCIAKLDVSLKIREWHHVCVVLTPSLQLYYNGQAVTISQECTVNGNATLVDEDEDNVEILIGGTLRNSMPFSGFLADVVLYDEVLSSAEVKDLAAGSKTRQELINVNQSLFEGANIVGTLEGVTFGTVEIKELVATDKHTSYIYCQQKSNFDDAKEFCKKLGAQQLVYTQEKSLQLSKELVKYIAKMPNHINEIWVQHSVVSQNEETCSLLLVNQKFPSVQYADCHTIAYAFCEIQKDRTFKLLGFKDDYLFFTVYDTPGIFEGFNYRLVYKDMKMTLENVQNGKILFERQLYNSIHVMGRHKWRATDTVNRETKVTTMTFTACQETQFTCSNGDCVDLGVVCDFVNDCQDATDEILCNDTASFPVFYSKMFSPSQGNEGVASVNLKVTLEQVKTVDLTNNLLEIGLRLDVTWRDTRVHFKFLKEGTPVRLSGKVVKELWFPRVRMDSAVPDSKDKFDFSRDPKDVDATARGASHDTVLDSYEVRMFNGAETDLHLGQADTIIFMCNMNLFFYPFDIQVCKIPLRLSGQMMTDARWNASQVAATIDANFVLTLFHVIQFSVSVPSHRQETRERERSDLVVLWQAVVVVKLARKYGAYIFNTVLPCITLEIIGFLTHSFPTEDFSNRCTATLSCLIVKAAFFLQVCASPPSPHSCMSPPPLPQI